MFPVSIYAWEPPLLSSHVHLFLVWINWKHVSTTDKYQRGQATRLLWILELLLFYFSFWTEDKRGLNKHAEPAAAPLPMEGHILLVFHRGGLPHKEKLFKLIWYFSAWSPQKTCCWFDVRHASFVWAQTDPARSDWYRRNVILYSADGRQGCIITITGKLAWRTHLIML